MSALARCGTVAILLAAVVLPLAVAVVAPADYWLGERGVPNGFGPRPSTNSCPRR